MRKELKQWLNKKVQVKQATVERYGLKSEFIGGDSVTILLKDILLFDGRKEIIVDHAWMNCGKWFEKANLKTGSKVSMNCHVKEYEKGYVNFREFIDERVIDIGVQRASKIQNIEEGNGETLETFIKNMLSSGKFISNKYELVKAQ